MITKKRHSNADTETFNYNIQNWLTKKISGTYEQNLEYKKAGNIASVMWKNGSATNKYIYEYDGLNRLLSGVLENGSYGEHFTYDKNGNINTLKRYSKTTLIDDLEMDDWSGNQLMHITEKVLAGKNSLTNINSLKEYRQNGDGTFKYDENGNLTEDSDRKILQIEYNVLNLPTRILFKGGNEIINIYAADGRKLEAIYLTKITEHIESIELTLENESEIREINGKHYIGNFEYEYSVLQDRFTPQLTKIFNAEGYVETDEYFCFRKDHLGNNREVAVVNGTTLKTVQTNNYYPSGLLWVEDTKGLKIQQNTQPYKYNGKEYIEDFGYDCYAYGFRDYYATIGRFTSLDPLAERNYSGSCYQYATSNFINEIDWMGLAGSPYIGSGYGGTEGRYDQLDLRSGRWILGDDFVNLMKWIYETLYGRKQGTLGGALGGGGGVNIAEAATAYLNGNISGDVYNGIMMSYFNGITLPDPHRVFNYTGWEKGDPNKPKVETDAAKDFYNAIKGGKIAIAKTATRVMGFLKIISPVTEKKTLKGLSKVDKAIEIKEKVIDPLSATVNNEGIKTIERGDITTQGDYEDGQILQNIVTKNVGGILNSILNGLDKTGQWISDGLDKVGDWVTGYDRENDGNTY